MINDPKIKEHRNLIIDKPWTAHYVDWVENANQKIRAMPLYTMFKQYNEKNPQFWGTVKTGEPAEFWIIQEIIL